jgi:RNA polymerase sigma factor (sigma-70 family)
METPQNDFAALMERIRDGSPEAAKELVERYGHRILAVVRRRLDERIRRRCDSEDFVQAVWASFFVGHPPPGYQFDNADALIYYLIRLAKHKVVDEIRRRYGTKKNDIDRERSLERSGARDAHAVACPLPTPSQMAIAKEQWDRLTNQRLPKDQLILEMRRDGKTYEQIAKRVRLPEHAVRNLVRLLTLGD